MTIKTFVIMGNSYHDNKAKFKNLLKSYGMKWEGTYPNTFKWSDGKNIVLAEYTKDEKDITIESKLIYQGDTNTLFYRIFNVFVLKEMGAKIVEDNIVDIEQEKEKYIKMVEHDLECMRKNGAPEGFIRLRKIELMYKCP